MEIQFYCARAARLPLAADIHISVDGLITYHDNVPQTPGVLKVVVETYEHNQPTIQSFTMFNLIYRHQLVTVSFHGFDQKLGRN